MADRFAGQAVWITGGGTGLGRALALEFAREGARVIVTGRRADRLEKVVSLIEAVGSQGAALPCDIADEDQVAAAARQAADLYGRLDVVVANAGFSVNGRIENLEVADWRRQFEVNVFGLLSTIRYALPEIRKTRGRLAVIASVAAFLPVPGNGAYCASKATVRSIGTTLSAELHGSGVSCTTIHPGFVESEIAQVDNAGVHHPDRVDKRPAALMWAADRAAVAMVHAIYKRRREYVFTGHGKFGAFLGSHFPGLTHELLSRSGRGRPALEGE